MIRKGAVRAFLRQPRKDCRVWKRFHEDRLDDRAARLPVQPPIWHKLQKHQKVCFLLGALTRRFYYLCDTGCVDGSTLIETDTGPVRIDELERQGKSIRVWSNTPDGLRLVDASCPFRRGPTDLFEVTFASGRKMTVTARHRFLTTRGWVFCSDAEVGERLPVFDVCHPQSSLAPSLSMCQPDDPCCWDRAEGFRVDCYQDHHRGGEPLPSWSTVGQVCVPSLIDFPERNHVYQRQGDPVSKRTNNLSVLSARLSTLRSKDRDCHDSNYREYPLLECDSVPFGCYTHISKPNAADANLVSPVDEVEASLPNGSALDEAPKTLASVRQQDNPSASFDSIVSIQHKIIDYYYDLHVPVHENYIAHGLCHHNTGKTLLIIALVRYFHKLGLVDRVLILVPNLINKGEWVEQLQIHSPKSTYTVLAGSSVEKWSLLEDSDSLFVIETYAGLLRMLCVRVKNKKGKTKLTPDKKLIQRFSDQVQGLVGDESFSVQNRNKLPFKVCRSISKASKIAFMMTGTPFNRNPESLWAQMFLVDFGKTLGQTLGLFRAAFFNERSNGWSIEYVFDKNKEGLLHQILAHRSIEYEADSSTLPAVVPITKKVYLPEDAGRYYRRAVEAIIAAKGNVREMKNIFTRMRQISSGFIGYYDDEEGARAEFEFATNPKLDLLLSLVESIREDYKVIIFTEFTHSGERIISELGDMGVGAVHIYGKSKHVSRERDRFKYDNKIQVMVLQNQMSYGLNVQVAKYGIFYESPVSALIRKQARRRVERQHSLHKSVFIYDLVCKGTVDEKILSFHREGGDLFDSIVRGKIKARDLLASR